MVFRNKTFEVYNFREYDIFQCDNIQRDFWVKNALKYHYGASGKSEILKNGLKSVTVFLEKSKKLKNYLKKRYSLIGMQDN